MELPIHLKKDNKAQQIFRMCIKSPRLVRKFVRLYNELCQECRNKVVNDPGMPYEQYCPNCQTKAKEMLKKWAD